MPEPVHPQLPRAAHGGPSRVPFEGPDFSVNSNPFGPNPMLVEAAREAAYDRYPEPTYRRIREQLAALHGVTPQEVVPAVGASELLHRLARAYLRPGDSVLSVGPVFGELKRAVALQEADCRTLGREEAAGELRRFHPKFVYLSRPNNPLGTVLNEDHLHELAQSCAQVDALLILDEAYAPFVPELPPFEHPAAVRLRSPGKVHGLVGLRPAYALAPPEVARALLNLAPAWALPAPTAAVLGALPGAEGFVGETLPLWREHARQLATDLAETLPVDFTGLPFFTLEVGNAAGVAAALLGRGCRVRDCTSYGLPARLRVSARRLEENALLVQAVREVVRG